jgi:hypothetical protein
LVLPDERNVSVFELGFLADPDVIQDDAVGAAAVGNKDAIVSELDDRMKAADAGIIQNKIVGISPAHGDDRFVELQDSVFPVRRGDDQPGHKKWLLLL